MSYDLRGYMNLSRCIMIHIHLDYSFSFRLRLSGTILLKWLHEHVLLTCLKNNLPNFRNSMYILWKTINTLFISKTKYYQQSQNRKKYVKIKNTPSFRDKTKSFLQETQQIRMCSTLDTGNSTRSLSSGAKFYFSRHQDGDSFRRSSRTILQGLLFSSSQLQQGQKKKTCRMEPMLSGSFVIIACARLQVQDVGVGPQKYYVYRISQRALLNTALNLLVNNGTYIQPSTQQSF
jgi:hypothetical protein